jgi:hypothetical protein
MTRTDAEIMSLIGYFLLVMIFGGFYFPVYFPFLVSFAVRSKDRREIRGSLRIASIALLLTALLRVDWTYKPKPVVNDDAPTSIRRALYYSKQEKRDDWTGLKREFVCTWGGGLLCTGAALGAGYFLRARRLRRDKGQETVSRD